MANSDILANPGAIPAPAPAPAAPRKAAPQPAKAAAPPAAGRSNSIAGRIERARADRNRELVNLAIVMSVSLCAHAILGAVLWNMVLSHEQRQEILGVIIEQEPILDTSTEEVQIEEIEKPDILPEPPEEMKTPPPEQANVDLVADIPIGDVTADFGGDGPLTLPSLDGGTGPGIKALKGDIASGRSQAGQKLLVREFGGTEASQASVASGLRWIASVQRDDGSWNFADIGESGDPGKLEKCDTGATGLALLAFLGAGHTHEKNDEGKFSPYRDNVAKGINFLLKNAKATPDGADLRGVVVGNEGMYVQGICTMALCEAHALTKDRRLRQVAQAACQFIINAQDPKGGGWRYTPKQPGDTSVVGWQLMSLLSARSAKLPIPQSTLQGVNAFLDSMAAEGGAQYGYDKPEPGRPGTTSIGLLSRMVLGWKQDNPALKQGIEFLTKTGPSPNDMYYNYYATQAVFTYATGFPKDSPEYALWVSWNSKLREHLVSTQDKKEGPERGSWRPAGGHSDYGGRLFQTCMTVMTLEVYYRKLPIYDRKKIQVDL